MLLAKDSELLTRVGPGTALGEMMRRYWHPIALSTQVSIDDTPLRTKLLGQPFVVFRDSSGTVGVLNEMCMHRGVSLALGRNEMGGLRCLYHGWKFAADGTILETPNHADCRFRERMKAPAYPVREQSGLIWTYIGPSADMPPFRKFLWDTVDESARVVFRANTKASYLPMWEGGLDSSHVAILHANTLRPGWNKQGANDGNVWQNLAPTYEIEDTEFGLHYCAFRDNPLLPTNRNARVVPAIMPYMRIIPDKLESNYAIEVPMDDNETATYIYAWRHDGTPIDRDKWVRYLGFDSPFYNPTTHEIAFSWENRMGQDRARLENSWTGIHGLEMEDFAMSASLRTDWDRTQEHLVTSDIAVVRLRKRLIEAIRKFQDGEPPPGVNQADMTCVIAFDRDLAAGDSWRDHAKRGRRLVPGE